MKIRTNADARKRIHLRIRKTVTGSESRPRLAVFRSARHIYVQAIDDGTGRTIASASSREGDVSDGGNQKGAQNVGTRIAERLKEKGVEEAVFDRGGFKYHGRVKALADAAREAGLKF